MKRVRIYARVSTKKQDVDIQLHALRTHAAQMGYLIIGEHVDEAISGAKGRSKRPGFNEICKAMEKKDCDMVLVWSIDRVARSLSNFSTFIDLIKKTGVQVYFHQQPHLSVDDVMGEIMLKFYGFVGEIERLFASARTKEAFAYGKSQGKVYGPSPKWTKAQRERVIELKTQGNSCREIGRITGMGLGTVGRIVKETPDRLGTA